MGSLILIHRAWHGLPLIPANAVTYWVGRAMQSIDYDLDETPKETDRTTKMMVRNVVHLATWLKANNYPGDPEAPPEKDQ